eukprot:CAMPEP_0183345090 /NCGR_PEP_ID=MMETSP0164_2-20130417/10611_1 /TAXON_ID=221442 /ORGANISM="Coccolithus pelagicus ssp braarudi, Strain PLY182g" /LENGTH=62 /DNA_ID=CAMNT_0025516187 /DNA_START=61 /DNA_END=246 /DNA_ORIENTATION=-
MTTRASGTRQKTHVLGDGRLAGEGMGDDRGDEQVETGYPQMEGPWRQYQGGGAEGEGIPGGG